MRSFHRLVFDAFVEGTTAVYTDPELNLLLAMTDVLEIVVIANQTSGTSPTLTVKSQVSANNRDWVDKEDTAEINAASLSTSAQTMAAGKSTAAEVTTGFSRLSIALGGTSPKSYLRIYATGRGEVVLER
jgi:hypothetical protein